MGGGDKGREGGREAEGREGEMEGGREGGRKNGGRDRGRKREIERQTESTPALHLDHDRLGDGGAASEGCDDTHVRLLLLNPLMRVARDHRVRVATTHARLLL